MQTKPKRNNGSQEKLQRKIAAIHQAIESFKNKEAYSREGALNKLNHILGEIDKNLQSANGYSLGKILSRLKIKF